MPSSTAPAGVADDGEVLEVHLGLFDEPLALLASDRGQRPALHRRRPLLEAADHGVDVEGVSHR